MPDGANKEALKLAAKESVAAALVGTGIAMAIDGGVSLENFGSKLLLMGAPVMVGGLAINLLSDSVFSSHLGTSKSYPYRALLGGAGALGFMILVGAAPFELSVGNALAVAIAAGSIAAGDYLVNGMDK